MQNIASLWTALDGRRRLIVLAATIGMFLAIIGLSRMASSPPMALLYSGLDSGSAGEVVRALEQRGVAYAVQGDSIQVDAALRDELRMTLATEGLPTIGASGYELLDGLSGFGTTSQMFDAAYWRAKEGELARTILANPQIRAARVHIAQTQGQPFRRDDRPTASVTVTTIGGGLPPLQASALKHLISAAVPGMQPDDVAVIDSVGGLVPGVGGPSAPGTEAMDRAAELRRNVERLLAARVGPGKAVVEVSVDVQTEQESIMERRFDPQGRVAISSETEERTNSATEAPADVTVASNLPEGDGAGGSGQSQSSETRETVNFEVSETQREILRTPGALRKISVAVLVDGLMVIAEDGTSRWQPRPEEELAVLRDLVASAVGLDETRGDVLTLRSLAFEPVGVQGTLAETGLWGQFGRIDIMSALQLAVLAMVALILGLFVLRPMFTAGPQRLPDLPSAAPLALPSGLQDGAGRRVLTGEIDDGTDLPQLPVVSRDVEEETVLDPVARLRRLIEQRQTESVEILRGWMETEEERT